MTSRRGDPQNPQYLVFDENGKSYKIGEVEGSKPTPAPSPPKLGAKNTLVVTDIAGTSTNTKGLGVFEHAKRQNEPISSSLTTKDVFGAQVDTYKRGIQTTRNKHPLDSINYQYPGNSELEYKSPFSMTKKEAEKFARS